MSDKQTDTMANRLRSEARLLSAEVPPELRARIHRRLAEAGGPGPARPALHRPALWASFGLAAAAALLLLLSIRQPPPEPQGPGPMVQQPPANGNIVPRQVQITRIEWDRLIPPPLEDPMQTMASDLRGSADALVSLLPIDVRDVRRWQ